MNINIPKIKFHTNLITAINVNKNLDFYPGYHLSPYGHLETFIVAKSHRNSGVGTFFIKNIMNQIKKEVYSYVITQSGNIAVKKRNDQITSYHINLDN